MKITKLYTGDDNKSHFMDIDSNQTTLRSLGSYSAEYPVKSLLFRESFPGAEESWHNAPQPQYIVYLEGKVEIETSSGEKRTFLPGDIVFATDLTGEGHISRVITKGRALVITKA